MKRLLDPRRYFGLARRCLAGASAAKRARRAGIPALPFDRLGRELGWRRMLRGQILPGLSELLNPLSLVRYFELDFALRHLPRPVASVLDVSSPRLLPLLMARLNPDATVTSLNPDEGDLLETSRRAGWMGLANFEALNRDAAGLPTERHRSFDYVSCVSVLEHVAGNYDDSEAIRALFGYVKPGGTLVVTVPLSPEKKHEDEYLPEGALPYPGSHAITGPDGRYFFQRLYSEESVRDRLLRPLGEVETHIEWWGEARKGAYNQYHHSPAYGKGTDCTEFLEHYDNFNSYARMPGAGIAGIVVHKPMSESE